MSTLDERSTPKVIPATICRYSSPRMESRHSSEIHFQLLTVALSRAWVSSSIALLATCFACSTFMFVLLFRGAIAPFTHGQGAIRNARQKRRDGCVQGKTDGRPNDTGVWWREAC